MSETVTVPTPAPGKNPPTVTIDVLPKDVKQLARLKPKDGVRVILHGGIVEVSQREPSTEFPMGFAGSLRLEVSRVEIQEWNDFSTFTDESE